MNKIGAPKGKYKRYHRFREDRTKEIRSFEVGQDIPTTIDPGYTTAWILGMGPLPEMAYHNLMIAIGEKVRNIPKSEETKRKMSLAKLGVPKSPQHRENMKIARQKLMERRKA